MSAAKSKRFLYHPTESLSDNETWVLHSAPYSQRDYEITKSKLLALQFSTIPFQWSIALNPSRKVSSTKVQDIVLSFLYEVKKLTLLSSLRMPSS